VNAVLKQALTDHDNVTFDTGRIVVVGAGVLVAIVVLGMVVGAVLTVIFSPDHKIDFQNFGVGIGAVMTGFAALLAAYWPYASGDAKGKRHGTPV
jgi:hypothetical protein